MPPSGLMESEPCAGWEPYTVVLAPLIIVILCLFVSFSNAPTIVAQAGEGEDCQVEHFVAVPGLE